MTRVIVNDTVRAQLAGPTGALEVCDEGGELLGFFFPLGRETIPPVPSPVSREELEKRRQQRTGSSLAEVLRRLPLA